jgi:hypothetical protein
MGLCKTHVARAGVLPKTLREEVYGVSASLYLVFELGFLNVDMRYFGFVMMTVTIGFFFFFCLLFL